MLGIKSFKKLMKNEQFSGSFFLIALLNLGNLFSYLFHFGMARMLGPADYGVLAALTNIIYIFGIPTTSIQTIVAKYTTRFAVKKEYGKIKGMFMYLLKQLMLSALFVFIIFFALSYFILSKKLEIPLWLLAITGIFLFGSFAYPLIIGVLQGTKKFQVWGWNFAISCLIKLVAGVLLVILGFAVYGAVSGFIFGTIIAFFIALPFMKDVLKSKEIKQKINLLSKENMPALLALLCLVFAYSLDVLLVKTFFSADAAGKYAVASMIGKIIFFGTLAIGNAMFPISSEKFVNGNKEKTRGVIKKTIIALAILCIIAVAGLILFPKLVVSILFGSQYISIYLLLPYLGIAFSFISFLNILILYRISVNEFEIYHVFLLALFLVLEGSLLFLFHQTLEQFSIVFMISSILVFLASYLLIKKLK